MGCSSDQVWKQLNSVQHCQYQARPDPPVERAYLGSERQKAPQLSGLTALTSGLTTSSISSKVLPLRESQNLVRLLYWTWKTSTSAQQNMNYLVVNRCAPNNPWKWSLLSLRLCASAYATSSCTAFEHSGPLLRVEVQICSSNCLKSSMALTTPLEERAPTVRWGYLDLNQAERAPAYDPPMVIHLAQGLIWCWGCLFICSMKQAMSLNACFELRCLSPSRVQLYARRGSDSPQQRCSRAITKAWVYFAICPTHELRLMPRQGPSPPMQSSTGPWEGSQKVRSTQQRWFQV